MIDDFAKEFITLNLITVEVIEKGFKKKGKKKKKKKKNIFNFDIIIKG